MWKIVTNQGEITCEHLIFATGNYARENARRVGIDLPCIPIVHQYWTTETVPHLIERKKDRACPSTRSCGTRIMVLICARIPAAFSSVPYEFEKDLKLFAEDRVPPEFWGRSAA